MLASHADWPASWNNLEKKSTPSSDRFDAIRQLMLPPEAKPKRKIGFHVESPPMVRCAARRPAPPTNFSVAAMVRGYVELLARCCNNKWTGDSLAV